MAPGHYQLADNWRVGSGEEGKKELIVSGIFSITKNPVYLYFTVFSFLLFLMIGKLIYFFLFLLVALSPHGIILYEEKNLEKLLKKNIWSIKKGSWVFAGLSRVF